RTHRRSGQSRLAEAELGSDGARALEAIEFLQPSKLVDRSRDLDDFVATLPRPSPEPASTRSLPLPQLVPHMIHAVKHRLKYEKKVTSARTPLSEALALGRGVCQDFAHLFLGACRGIGIPARYVSGYINGPGELATHAWCQVWGGRAGWIDVDPTRGAFADDHYVTTAVGRDFFDVPPNRGVWKGQADEVITVTVKAGPAGAQPPRRGGVKQARARSRPRLAPPPALRPPPPSLLQDPLSPAAKPAAAAWVKQSPPPTGLARAPAPARHISDSGR